MTEYRAPLTKEDFAIINRRVCKIAYHANNVPVKAITNSIKDYHESAAKYDAAVFAARFLKA